MSNNTAFESCPAFSSDRFFLRLVELDDAADLLGCYSDPLAVQIMNADNCTSDFAYQTIGEMSDCINGWLDGYRRGIIVRLSVIDIHCSKAIGTIEMYRKTRDTGILRLDLCSAYETQGVLSELLSLSTEAFYNAFGVKHILTKAIPVAEERISALRAHGFVSAESHAMLPYGDYYRHER